MTGVEKAPYISNNSTRVITEELTITRDYKVEITIPHKPGPNFEVRELFRKLYGAPEDYHKSSPFLATFTRFRTKLRPAAPNIPKNVRGSIEYCHWPDLKLGYIENVFVDKKMRRQGLGARLVNLATDHLRRKNSTTIYAFTVNPQGLNLLISAGFTSKSPEDPYLPWRCWVTREY